MIDSDYEQKMREHSATSELKRDGAKVICRINGCECPIARVMGTEFEIVSRHKHGLPHPNRLSIQDVCDILGEMLANERDIYLQKYAN